MKNKQILFLMTMICLGIFLLTGCSDTKTKGNTDVTSDLNTENTTNSNQINTGEIDRQETSTDDNDSGITNDKSDTNNDTPKANDTDAPFKDGNDAFNSADFSGTVTASSNSGCTVSKDSFGGDNSYPGGVDEINVVYDENTLFQTGTFKSDGSTYFLTACEKDSITNNAYVLVFFSELDDVTYLATKVIIVIFN